MKRSGKTKDTPACTRLFPDPIKDDRMRRWAGKIVSDLPSGMGDALIVLKYAERLLYRAAISDESYAPKKRGRAAR